MGQVFFWEDITCFQYSLEGVTPTADKTQSMAYPCFTQGTEIIFRASKFLLPFYSVIC